jgi:hypothetical protein
VSLGNYQNMGGGLGRNVPESVAGLIFPDLGRRDAASNNLTEQTIFHIVYLQIL